MSGEKADLKKENAVDSVNKEPEDEAAQGRGGRRSGGKRVSTIARTAQEGEALLKGLGHKEEGGGVEVENRRRTRSSTRGVPPTPPPPAKREKRTPASGGKGGSRRGRPRKEEEEVKPEEGEGEGEEEEVSAGAEANDKGATPAPAVAAGAEEPAAQEGSDQPETAAPQEQPAANMEVEPQQDGKDEDQPAENAIDNKQDAVCTDGTENAKAPSEDSQEPPAAEEAAVSATVAKAPEETGTDAAAVDAPRDGDQSQKESSGNDTTPATASELPPEAPTGTPAE